MPSNAANQDTMQKLGAQLDTATSVIDVESAVSGHDELDSKINILITVVPAGPEHPNLPKSSTDSESSDEEEDDSDGTESGFESDAASEDDKPPHWSGGQARAKISAGQAGGMRPSSSATSTARQSRAAPKSLVSNKPVTGPWNSAAPRPNDKQTPQQQKPQRAK